MDEPGPPPPEHVSIDIRSNGVAIVTIAKEPVNSMDLALWQALDTALASLEQNPKVGAVVLCSGLKKNVFSAGNDLKELYAPQTSLERYSNFWKVQNGFLVRLYRSRLATVAAIRGACPAGGCIISLCCDYRLITPDGTIGLNEVQLGIPVPKYWAAVMAFMIGFRQAEGLLLTGRMPNALEAKGLGMVDEIVEQEKLIEAAEATAARLAKVPNHARSATKSSLREDLAGRWEAFFPTEPKWAWKFLNQPATLKTLGAAMARLSSKPQAKL